MKKVLILAAVAAIAATACNKTFEAVPTAEAEIGFGTWTEHMTKAKTEFVANDEFDVFGYKWMTAGTPAPVTVFDGVDVKYDGTNWTYAPARFWDSNYDNYTFFAAWPKDILAAGDYAQTGSFITNDLDFNGADEKLMIAQKKDVAKAQYGNTVPLVFKHEGSLIDIKFKKHDNLADAVVEVTGISLSNIQSKGHFTVASYNTDNDPVGTAGVGGWEPAAPTVKSNYDHTAGTAGVTMPVSLAASTGNTTATAGALVNNLVVMPQVLGGTADDPKLTISYKITTGTGADAQTIEYTDNVILFSAFDKTDPNPDDKDNTTPFITTWEPGVHYIYYITINANIITFSATISAWTTTEVYGHHYLIK